MNSVVIGGQGFIGAEIVRVLLRKGIEVTVADNFGMLTGIVDSVSPILQTYSVAHPKIAEAAAEQLDGQEVQTEVGLQLAIREMTGRPASLVIQPPPPAVVASKR